MAVEGDIMKSEVLTRKWVKCALVRAVKTFAQAAIGTIGASVVLADVDWIVVLSASVLAAVLSLLTSLAGLPEVDDDRDSDAGLPVS
jgi:hypothetical protein